MNELPAPHVTLRTKPDRRQMSDRQRIDAIQRARADFLHALRVYQDYKARLEELIREAQ